MVFSGCGREDLLSLEGRELLPFLGLLLSPMERGASTLEERKPFRWERREALFIVWSLLLSVIGIKPKLYLFFFLFDFVSCYYSQRVLISIKGLV